MKKNNDCLVEVSAPEFSFFNDSSPAFCHNHNPPSPRLITSINAELNKATDELNQHINEVSDEITPHRSNSPMQESITSPALGINPQHPVKLQLQRPAVGDDNQTIKQLISDVQETNHRQRDELPNCHNRNYINRRPSPIKAAQRRNSDARAMAMVGLPHTLSEAPQMQQNRRLSRHHSLSRSRGSSPSRFSQNREFNHATQSPIKAKKPRSSSYSQLALAETNGLEKIDEGDSSSSSSSSMKAQLALLMKSWGITSSRKSSSSFSISSLSSSSSRVSSQTNGADKKMYSPRRSVSDGHGSAKNISVCFTNEARPELCRSKSLTSRILSKKPWKDLMKCKPTSAQKQAAEVPAPSPTTPPRRSSASAGSGDDWSAYNNTNNYYYYYYYYGSNSAPTSPANGNVPPGRLSPNAMHYHYQTNKVRSHELKRKTFLPYRQSFLGCLGGGAFASMSGHNPRLVQQAW